MEGELLKVQSKLENKQESSVVLERSKSTIVHKIFKTNSSFHVKWRTRGGVRGGGAAEESSTINNTNLLLIITLRFTQPSRGLKIL